MLVPEKITFSDGYGGYQKLQFTRRACALLKFSKILKGACVSKPLASGSNRVPEVVVLVFLNDDARAGEYKTAECILALCVWDKFAVRYYCIALQGFHVFRDKKISLGK